MKQEMVVVSRKELQRLRRSSKVDVEFLKELAQSLDDIRSGRVKRVR